MSSGAGDVALALASGARPAGVVFVSGIHSRVIATLGTPERLPPTLVVHHSRDGCKFTLPSSATDFVAWSRGKARLRWINTSGPPGPRPCGRERPRLLPAGWSGGFRHYRLHSLALRRLRRGSQPPADPMIRAPEQAQAMFEKAIPEWAEYVRIAKIPQT